MLRSSLWVLLCLWPALLSAQGLPSISEAREGLQPLATRDDVRPFAAVGRLDTGTGFCTATLITPELVLTAAHCLFDAHTGARRPDSALIFSAALRYDQTAAQRRVRVSFLHPDYSFGAPSDAERVQSDIALLRLEHPIALSAVRPIDIGGRARRGDDVVVVSYGRDRENFASLEEGCGVITRQIGVFVLSCSVVSGSSGAPVMVETPSGHRIVAVVSASAAWRAEPVALAARLEGEIEQLLVMAGNREPGMVSASLPQVRILGQHGDGRESSGARFLRP